MNTITKQKQTNKIVSPEYQLIYISSLGRSGSTLIDIILGEQENHFSLGELNNLTRAGLIHGEYCSCGAIIEDCPFWSKVIMDWNKVRNLSIVEYRKATIQYVRTKGIFRFFKNMLFPSENFRAFVADTRSLYDILLKHTNGAVLVESSKRAQKIWLLRKIGLKIKVIHLTRKFSGVLNSNKKFFKKDVKAGVERDLEPNESAVQLALKWLLGNFMIFLFSLGSDKARIRYDALTENLTKTIKELNPVTEDFGNKLQERGVFVPGHLVAGSRIRMQKEISVSAKPHDRDLSKLSRGERILVKLLDHLF